ncbi:MAG: 8-oxo-dGTP diphosphatase [Deltaproteobacteria bacterium]|nr:8-oxo-dGTP diphosphatase [Deltaproteobacteria bacterium]
MHYTPIVATLGYVFDAKRERVLLIHRNARHDDHHLGKYNGLGGKLEADEHIVAGMQRELNEEAGITATDLTLAGTINWPGFGQQGEDWLGFIFVIRAFAGQLKTHNDEGELRWVPLGEVESLPLWEGDRHFLPLVFAEPLRRFHGVMPYGDGRPLSWSFCYLD